MLHSNDDRQEFLDAVEAYAFRHGSRTAMLKMAGKLRGCSDIIPSNYRDIVQELIGGDTPPFTFEEARQGLVKSLGA